MTILICRGCGSGVLVREPDATPPETCNNCDPAIQAALAAVVNYSEVDEVMDGH